MMSVAISETLETPGAPLLRGLAPLDMEEFEADFYSAPDGFAEFDAAHLAQRAIHRDLITKFGDGYDLYSPQLIATPNEVVHSGEVLTNISQLELVRYRRRMGSGTLDLLVGAVRREPAIHHLGNTVAEFRILQRNKNGLELVEFSDAQVLKGEDARVTPGIRLPGHLGRVHEGVCVSTVEAVAVSGHPDRVESIKQVINWGPSLKRLEPVAEIKGHKNACVSPVARDDRDTRVHALTRPFPDTHYQLLPDITALDENVVTQGVCITADVRPENFHTGPNMIKNRGANLLEIDAHEAYREPTPCGDALHYSLVTYGYELPSPQYWRGRLIALGPRIRRNQFPHAQPKPPQNSVASFYDVLYGSLGRAYIPAMIVGISDNGIAFARKRLRARG